MAPPKELHPSATGLAKPLVDAHQAPQPLVLYAGWFCPFGIPPPPPPSQQFPPSSPPISQTANPPAQQVQRVWLVLEEKQVPYQYIEVNPYSKPASLLSLNPRGLVPTLSTTTTPSGNNNNKPLYESNIICEYLEDAYPSHLPHLLPQNDPYEKARCRIWMDFVSTRLIPAFHRFLQWQPSDAAAAPTIAGRRKEFLDILREFAGAMDNNDGRSDWFSGGDEIGMVDLVAAPWAVRLWVFDHFKEGGLGVPSEGGEGDDEVWGRWRRWVSAVEGRKSVRETGSEREYYVPIYRPYADDTAQSALAKAIREGRGVP